MEGCSLESVASSIGRCRAAKVDFVRTLMRENAASKPSSDLSLVPQRGVKHAQVPCRDRRRVRLKQRRRRRRSGRRTRRHAGGQSPRQPLQPAARHTLLQRQAFICIEQQSAQDSCSFTDSNVHVLPALRRAAGAVLLPPACESCPPASHSSQDLLNGHFESYVNALECCGAAII